MQILDIFVKGADGSCAGIGVCRNPAYFNRRFVINKIKKHTGDIIRCGDGRYVGSEYWDEWARYRPGEGEGEGERVT